jgi:hypothetical protein
MKVVYLVFFGVFYIASSSAKTTKVDVPFLFKEDQQAKSVDLITTVKESNELKSDPFLSSPLTYLDYILIKIEERLNNQNDIQIMTNSYQNDFESLIQLGRQEKIKIEGNARFHKGKVIVGYTISNVGKPKKPLVEICKNTLAWLQQNAPQELYGYTYHNTVLGILAQKESAYDESLRKLANNIIHRITINSETDNGKTNHDMICWRENVKSEIQYQKQSFKIKTTEIKK